MKILFFIGLVLAIFSFFSALSVNGIINNQTSFDQLYTQYTSRYTDKIDKKTFLKQLKLIELIFLFLALSGVILIYFGIIY